MNAEAGTDGGEGQQCCWLPWIFNCSALRVNDSTVVKRRWFFCLFFFPPNIPYLNLKNMTVYQQSSTYCKKETHKQTKKTPPHQSLQEMELEAQAILLSQVVRGHK